MSQQTAFAKFRDLPAIEPTKLVGLWKGRGIATGHPFDGVLENLGWFGKRFAPDLRADALLFRSGERRLTAINPSMIPWDWLFASITSVEHVPRAIYSHIFTGA